MLYVPSGSLELPASVEATGRESRIASSRPPLTISLVTPSFNQREFLERTIASVVGQRYPALEFVVQDGGSTDGSVDLLEAHASQLARWDSRPDSGQSAAINAGFCKTTGEIMSYLNSDDILFPGALQYVADFFASHPDVDVVYSNTVMIDTIDRPLVLWLLPEHDDESLWWYDYVPQPTLFWRRSAWTKAGSHVDESLHYAMDWDLLHRFLYAGARFARLPTLLAAFRVHGGQKTQRMRQVGQREVAALRLRHVGRRVSFAEVALRSVPHVIARARLTTAYRLGWLHPQFPREAGKT